MSSDIKAILKCFYIRFREVVNPQDITPLIDGLTDFDIQQIVASTKNDGDMIGNDKLLDTLKRRPTRSFLSFITLLNESNPDFVEEVKSYMKTNCCQIYDSFQKYQRDLPHGVPLATVKPSISHHPLDCPSRNSVEQKSETVSETFYTRHEESRETCVRSSRVTVQRREVLHSHTYSEETFVEDLPNIIFKKWVAELNKCDNWMKLGDIMGLTRKKIKEIKKEDDPGEEVLDLLCKPDFTVRELMYLLESAELMDCLQIVKQGLEPTVLYEETTEVRTRTDNLPHRPGGVSAEVRTNNLQQQPGPQDDPNHNRDRLEKKEYKAEKVETEINDMNISLEDSVKSTTDNDKVPTTDLPPGGAEGGTKTLINSLSTSTFNFDKVGTVYVIQKGNGGVNENALYTEDSMDSIDQNISSEDNVTPSPVRNREDDPLQNPSREGSSRDVNQTPTKRKDENSPLSQSLNKPRSTLFQSPSGAQGLDTSSEDIRQPHSTRTEVTSSLVHIENSLVVDQGHGSTDGSNTSGQLLFHQPTDNQETSKNFGKNIEQEHLALNRDILNQPNMDSYRDIQNSIPGSRLNDGSNEINSLSQGEDRLHNRIGPIQNTSQVSNFTTNYEKNPEQERLALRRDVAMQNQILMPSNLCDEHQTSTKQLDENTS